VTTRRQLRLVIEILLASASRGRQWYLTARWRVGEVFPWGPPGRPIRRPPDSEHFRPWPSDLPPGRW